MTQEHFSYLKLSDILSILAKRKILYVTVLGAFLVGTWFFTKQIPKQYRATTTFFIKQDQGQAGGAFGAYSQLFGGRKSDNMSNYIYMLAKSRRMQGLIVLDLTPQFKSELDKAIKNGKIEDTFESKQQYLIHGLLKLPEALTLNQSDTGEFIASFQNENPDILPIVLNCFVKKIADLNRELDLSPQRELITILDTPLTPKSPSYPNMKLNLMMAFVIGNFFAILFILLIDFRKLSLKQHP